MRKYNASLKITESISGSFTKSVVITFDNRCEYIISTYRPGDFKKNTGHAIISSQA
jgi:hypothetical protein